MDAFDDGGEQVDEGSVETVEAADVEAAGPPVERPRRVTRPRMLVAAVVVAAFGLAAATWISDRDSGSELTVSATDEGDPSPTTVAAVEPEATTSSTTSTAEVTTTTASAPAAAPKSPAASGTRTTTAPATTAPSAEPSWAIELHDVSVTPSTVAPGQTITVSWRLVSEIGINQTFFYLSWPQDSPSFPAPSDDCPHFTVVPPASGTDRDGVYRVTCRVPDDTTPAMYRINIMARHHRHDPGKAEYFYDRARFTVTAPPPTTTSTTSAP